eukprot:m.106156 g.106156  ORF g.106156 m.106156 type:complete len:126 (+) comp22526_c0_seq1:2697-3074(+)
MLSVRWLPSELLLDNIYSHKTDIWSAGIVMYEVFSFGMLPFSHVSTRNAFIAISQGKNPGIPERTPVEMHKIMNQCWETQPHNRPSPSYLVDYLEDIYLTMTRGWESRPGIQDRTTSFASLLQFV